MPSRLEDINSDSGAAFRSHRKVELAHSRKLFVLRSCELLREGLAVRILSLFNFAFCLGKVKMGFRQSIK